MILDWSTITTIILGSSLLGAVLSNLVSWAIRHAERTRQVNYLALHLAYIFETFAYTCLSAVEDHDTAEDSDDHAGKYLLRVPEFPQLPDFDYRNINLTILDRVFDFPQQVNFANESLAFELEILDVDNVMEDSCKSSIKLAEDALFIADSIRSCYKLPKRELKFGEYSVRERLKEKSNRMNKLQAGAR